MWLCHGRVAHVGTPATVSLLPGQSPVLGPIGPHTVRTVLCAPIDEDVWRAVERCLRNPALIAQEIERQQADTSEQDATLERGRLGYAKQLAKCEREHQRLLDLYLDAVIARDVYESRKALIDAKRSGAKRSWHTSMSDGASSGRRRSMP
jgi:hypothetical protein